MKITSVRRPIIAFMFSCSVLGAVSCWAAPGTTNSLTVFDCGARYLQLNAPSGAALGSGVYGVFTQSHSRVDGCLIADVADKNQKMLYALMPEDPRLDENGEQRFIVGVLDRKTLKVVHKYELPNKQAARPMLLFDSSRQELLVAMDNYETWQRLEIKSDGSLSPSGPSIAIQTPFPTSPVPYIDEQGNIVDGLRVLDPQGRLIKQVQADAILDPALQEDFASLTLVNGSTRHYYGTIPAASAADRIVFTVGWDTEATRVPSAGVIVYDLGAGRVISSFHSVFSVAPGYTGEAGVPSLHLSPDGRKIVLEQYEWQPTVGEPSGLSRFRTGKIAVYDADTGLLTGTVIMDASHAKNADGHLIDFSNDGHSLYYWFDRHLYVIDLRDASIAATVVLPDNFEPARIVSGQ